jgi:tRNA-modifying protein YgfZ
MSAQFVHLKSTGVIAFTGAEAINFLHAQLTSDVVGLEPRHTQYSGYCNAKGRLLATVLLWRGTEDALLQLPLDIRDDIQRRLTRYILRSRVKALDVSAEYNVWGLSGDATGTQTLIRTMGANPPEALHEGCYVNDLWITRVPGNRYLILAPSARRTEVQDALAASCEPQTENDWNRLEIDSGVPTVVAATQEAFIPQMVGLDALGGVSYRKGCYPGQEIVARTHYLGTLKQRLYRGRIASPNAPQAGDPLYSPEFGAAQASGRIVRAACADANAFDVLAVVQSSASGDIHWNSLEGPAVEQLELVHGAS